MKRQEGAWTKRTVLDWDLTRDYYLLYRYSDGRDSLHCIWETGLEGPNGGRNCLPKRMRSGYNKKNKNINTNGKKKTKKKRGGKKNTTQHQNNKKKNNKQKKKKQGTV